jgi:hypothetical protein
MVTTSSVLAVIAYNAGQLCKRCALHKGQFLYISRVEGKHPCGDRLMLPLMESPVIDASIYNFVIFFEESGINYEIFIISF